MSEKNLIERMIEVGLGMAAYSEEKLSKFVQEITEHAEEKRKEIPEMKKELKKNVAAFQEEFAKRVQKEVRFALKKMHVASTEDIAFLQRRIKELEKKAGIKKAAK